MISEKDVRHIANLAQLDITKADEALYAAELSRIMHFMEQIDLLEVEAIDPMSHPLDAVQRLRIDAVSEDDQREVLQAIAPAISDAFYTVPQVIE